VFKHLSKLALLIIDDFVLAPLMDQGKRDLLEIMEDRFDKSATLMTSQLPTKNWRAYINKHTLADAFLDRLVHNA
jgi:DNA replication protein DnaC